MATAISNPQTIDPARNGKFSITVSERLLSEGQRPGRRFTSVQCMFFARFLLSRLIKRFLVNHKPKLATRPQKTILITSASSTSNKYNLAIRGDGDNSDYLYTGTQQPSGACALIYDPTRQTFTLDKIATEFNFNLHSTPSDRSAKSLTAKYPQLEIGVSDPDSNDDSASNPQNSIDNTGDISNPYDYRHFLNKKRRRASTLEPPSNPVPTPTVRRPSRVQKPKPKQRSHPHHPEKRQLSPPPPEEADADNEDSDSGGLTIEMDPDTRPRGRFAGAFSYDARKGPISLRSAASSVSPAGPRGNVVASQEKVSSPEGGEEREEREEEEQEEESERDGEQSDNNDVPEDLELPGPRLTPREEEDEDEGDLLEAELEQALESQADEEGAAAMDQGRGRVEVRSEVEVRKPIDESSSESEEE